MKTKIVFAGVMGAILMSVGANAATTSVATKGYVDQLVGNTVASMDAKYVTIQQVTEAIENNVDLTPYQLTDNIVQTLNNIPDADKSTKYPSVAAVAEAIENLDLGLSPEQITQLQELIKSDGVVSQINTLQSDVNTLKTDVATLNGADTVEGSVAKSIADAITTHTAAADAKYQSKSNADFQIGTTGGVFRDMTDAEKAALQSGVTAEKVTGYDALTGENGVITKLQEAIDGLNGVDGADGTIAEIQKTIQELQDAVDGINGTDGTITTIQETITKLQDAIDGLNGTDGADGTITTIEKSITELKEIIGDDANGMKADITANSKAIAENAAAIAGNAEDIATNAAAIANKITMPAACVSGNQTCVLMSSNGTVTWTPVTSPVEDPVSGGTTGE